MNAQLRLMYKQLFWPVSTGLLIALVFILLQQNQALKQASTGHDISSDSGAVRSYADAVARALPAVVKIDTRRIVAAQTHPLLRDPLFSRLFNNNNLRQNRVERGLGSGVIVNEQGYILTNNHVIANVDRIEVMLADGRQQLAKVVGIDEPTDLAVLKIDLDNLKPAVFADSGSERIGDVVLAIGNPYGIGQTVTQGIISATGRYGLQLNTYENYIQTDAAINRGNSGGALVNTEGLLIGINSALYSQTGGSNGIGFAIPAETATYVLDNIIKYGEVIRGWLGVSVEDLTPAIADAYNLSTDRGLIVTSVVRNGPASGAGLRLGDIITHINGGAVGSGNAGMHQIAQTMPGAKVNIRVLRDGAALSLLAEIGKKPAENTSRG